MPIINTYLCKKAASVRKLQDAMDAAPARVEIAKIIELTQAQYSHFSSHLLDDMPFIKANRDIAAQGSRQDAVRCLLVTTREGRNAILVDSQGYDYARYAAFIPDKTALDLRNVPVERCLQPIWRRNVRRER